MGFAPFTARVEPGSTATTIANDSVGLRAFLAARERAEANGRQLLLFGAKPQVRRVFEITGKESLLESENIAVLYS